jgi:4-carboxymuconolactone decarboxylase
MNPDHESLLRRLALNEEDALESLLGTALTGVELTGVELAGADPVAGLDADPAGLDAKAAALVRLAGLVAIESAPASYQWSVAAALAAGATDAEVVGVLVALTPVVGVVRVNVAAPEVALAMGCDLSVPGNG